MKKLRMRVDELQVESFPTGGHDGRRRGTVRGHGEDCTWVDTCLCHTAYHQCGTGMETIFSCEYTLDDQCLRTAVDCRDTSYAQCGTRADTPAC
jgi:hypothetical protein